MSDEAWYKMLLLSLVLHVLIVGAFSIPIKFKPKKFDLSSSYSVNLVGGAGELGDGPKKAAQIAPEKKAVAEKPIPVAKEKPVQEKKVITAKSKPIPPKKGEELLSISKKKVPEKETTSDEDLDRLRRKIQNLRKKVEYIDVAKSAGGGSGKGSGSGGLPLSGEGTGRPLDPLVQKYYLEIWEKIKAAWNVPGMATGQKDLETVVAIKIRKDGRIVNIDVEKRSGNRIYDESILRVLRAVEPLPPIPESFNTDSLEVGFRFIPGGLS